MFQDYAVLAASDLRCKFCISQPQSRQASVKVEVKVAAYGTSLLELNMNCARFQIFWYQFVNNSLITDFLAFKWFC